MTSKEDADVVIKQLDVYLREIQFFEPVDNNISQYQKYYKVKHVLQRRSHLKPETIDVKRHLLITPIVVIKSCDVKASLYY